MHCYVYIVQCSNEGLYTGMTNNIRRRLKEHNGITKGGAYYTKMHRPVFLQHIERYPTRKEARHRELKIQSMSHKQKLKIVTETTKTQILSAI
jgi:putative endonuclease